jgi:uncharacterized protein
LHLPLAIAGFVVGGLVGLTGMGGGALLTPVLVLIFRVALLPAISSDLLTSLVMKPVGAAVHLRRGNVNWTIVRWLTAGSVPAAFAAAALIGSIGHAQRVQTSLRLAIGAALFASAAATMFRQTHHHHARRLNHQNGQLLVIHPLRTIGIGVCGGLAVGMTSAGAGSLIIAMLLIAYPQLHPSHLVGTDIVQAIPLVTAATMGHLLFGDLRLAVTASLVLGALPGIYLGARLSAQGHATVITAVVAAVLLISALTLWNVPTPLLITAVIAALVVMAFARAPAA